MRYGVTVPVGYFDPPEQEEDMRLVCLECEADLDDEDVLEDEQGLCKPCQLQDAEDGYDRLKRLIKKALKVNVDKLGLTEVSEILRGY